MVIFFFLILLCITAVAAFLNQPKFGKIRENGAEQVSGNWREGQFQNLHHTPSLTEGVSYYTVLKEFFFDKKENIKPPSTLPGVKTDLFSIDPNSNAVVWFGHSSYFLQVEGKKILVDPVFSGAASPIKMTTRSFPGSDRYRVEDIPPDRPAIFIP